MIQQWLCWLQQRRLRNVYVLENALSLIACWAALILAFVAIVLLLTPSNAWWSKRRRQSCSAAVNCRVSDWPAWSSCTRSCGGAQWHVSGVKLPQNLVEGDAGTISWKRKRAILTVFYSGLCLYLECLEKVCAMLDLHTMAEPEYRKATFLLRKILPCEANTVLLY